MYSPLQEAISPFWRPGHSSSKLKVIQPACVEVIRSSYLQVPSSHCKSYQHQNFVGPNTWNQTLRQDMLVTAGKGLIIFRETRVCCQKTVDYPPNVVPDWFWMVEETQLVSSIRLSNIVPHNREQFGESVNPKQWVQLTNSIVPYRNRNG